MAERRITDSQGREWTVTRAPRSSLHGAPYMEVRAGSGGLLFRAGSEVREARLVVKDLGGLTDSELLAALWGAEPRGPEGSPWSRMVWNAVRRSA
jgi:hypothetical protein